MTVPVQPGILQPIPPVARYVTFIAAEGADAAFQAQMRRMAGAQDGITGAMFRIARPVNGAYLWCPPVVDERLDLRQLGL